MNTTQKKRHWTRTIARDDKIALRLGNTVVATLRTRKRGSTVSIQIEAIETLMIQHILSEATFASTESLPNATNSHLD